MKKKKLLICLLSMAFVATSALSMASCNSRYVTYKISEDGTYAEVVGYEGGEKNIRIAKSYRGLPVKTICENAFYNNDNIVSIKIPNSVTTIGEYAFCSCDKLKSAVIGDSVTEISYRAFYECRNLTSVKIGDSVTTINQAAFYNCDSLTSIELSDSVKIIESDAFGCCYRLTSLVIWDLVTTIGDGAFQNCYRLNSVYYKGQAKDWEKISISSNNKPLANTPRYYYSETKLAGCWYYNKKGEIVLWWIDRIIPLS